jgi:hypothetical protein
MKYEKSTSKEWSNAALALFGFVVMIVAYAALIALLGGIPNGGI